MIAGWSDKRLLIPATVLLLLVAIWLAPLSYHTLDEIILRSLMQGELLGYTGVDPRYTLYPNILFSRTVAALYTLQPSLPWYDITMLAVGLTAFVALLWASLDGVDSAPARLFRALIVLLLCLPVFISPQFTLTAGLSAIGGLMVAIVCAERGRLDAGPLILAFLTLLIAGLIRYPVLLLCALAVVLVMLPRGLQLLRRQPATTIGVALVVGLAAGTSVALQQFDRSTYHNDPALDAALRIGSAGLALRNYALISPGESVQQQISRRLDELGVAGSTFIGLKNSIYFDPDVHDVGKAEAISEAISPLVRRADNVGASMKEFSTHFGYRFRSFLADPVNQLFRLPANRKLESTHVVSSLLILTLLAVALGVRRSGVTLLYAGLVVAGLYVVIALLMRMPPFRIYYLLVLIIAFRLVTAYSGRQRHPASMPGRVVSLLSGALALTLAFNQVQAHVLTGHSNTRKHARIQQVVQHFDPTHIHVLETSFLNHYLLPFQMPPQHSGVRILSGGWHGMLPWYQRMLTEYGVSDGIGALCTNPDVRLVPAVGQSFRHSRLLRYLRLWAADRSHKVVREFKVERADGHPLHGCILDDAP